MSPTTRSRVRWTFKIWADSLDEQVAAVYLENPSYLGFLETRGQEIAEIAHGQGALCIVATEPLSLGVLMPPAAYGADLVCGDIQSLGIHMQYGGGHGGFIASHDRQDLILEYPSRLFGIAPTRVPGEYGFGDVAYERTSFAVARRAKSGWALAHTTRTSPSPVS